MSSGSGERLSPPNPHAPVSLVNPRNPDPLKRRAVAGGTATNGPPTGSTKGFKTLHRRYLHVVVKIAGGSTVDWKLWVQNKFSGEWGVDTRVGAGTGIQTLATADIDNPQNSILELVGSDMVYVELLNFGGGETVDVWLGAAGEEV